MFSAYFDASGTRKSDVLVVTGYVSRISKWVRFDQEWKALLEKYGVTNLHMTDFVSSKNEFSGWLGQTDRRREFMEELVACIRRSTNKGFSAGVVVEDFNAVDKEYPLAKNVGTPFSLCGMTCMGMLKRWADKGRCDIGKMLVLFEDGDNDRGDFQERVAQQGVTVGYLGKPASRAFQAADLAAWKVRTFINEGRQAETQEAAHRLLLSLSMLDGTLQHNGVFDKIALRNLCIRAEASEGMKP